MAFQRLLEQIEIVPGTDCDITQNTRGHAGRTGDGHRCISGTRFVQRRPGADIGLVAPAVIVTLELQNLVAAREGPGKAKGHQHGFRAGGREANQPGPGQQATEPLRQFGFARILRGEELAFAQ